MGMLHSLALIPAEQSKESVILRNRTQIIKDLKVILKRITRFVLIARV